jgi:hypothetical protein
VTTSIQFGVNNEVISDDIASHVIPANTLPDSQRGNHHIQVRTGGLTTYNTGSDSAATHRDNTTKVQLRTPDGKVHVAGFNTSPEAEANLRVMAPELFEAPEVKQAAANAATADAAAEEGDRVQLNTHPDQFVEESHTQFTNAVPTGLQIELLVQMNRDGKPSQGTLNRVADSLGVSVDEAATRLNAMAGGVQAQVIVLAKARGVNPEQFSKWARDNRSGESLRAMQDHVQSRNLLSWDGLINEFKARGQR